MPLDHKTIHLETENGLKSRISTSEESNQSDSVPLKITEEPVGDNLQSAGGDTVVKEVEAMSAVQVGPGMTVQAAPGMVTFQASEMKPEGKATPSRFI